MHRLSAIAGGLLLVVLAASPVLASDYAVATGSPTLSRSRVVLSVPVRLACPVPDSSYDMFTQNVVVDVSQASGKQIAHGEGELSGSPLIVCDGTWKSVTVYVGADPSGPPFNGGWMSISARAEFTEGVSVCGPGCGYIYVDEFAYSGPVDVKAG